MWILALTPIWPKAMNEDARSDYSKDCSGCYNLWDMHCRECCFFHGRAGIGVEEEAKQLGYCPIKKQREEKNE